LLSGEGRVLGFDPLETSTRMFGEGMEPRAQDLLRSAKEKKERTLAAVA